MGGKKKTKPVIVYPPVPTKKWVPPYMKPKPKPAPKYVKPKGVSQKLAISSLLKVWHDYVIMGDMAIIMGNFSQGHKRFTYKSNGKQGACNCVMACAYAEVTDMATVTKATIDRILIQGDQLYCQCIQNGMKCDTKITVPQVYNNFFIGNNKFTMKISPQPIVSYTITPVSDQKDIFSKAINNFFSTSKSGILSLQGKYFAIWKVKKAYYILDPSDHEFGGKKWKGLFGEGFSLLAKCFNLAALVDIILQNIDVCVTTDFDIFSCTVERIVAIDVVPPETFEDLNLMDGLTNNICNAAKPQGEDPPPQFYQEPKPPPVEPTEEEIQAAVVEKQELAQVEETCPSVGGDDLSESKLPTWMKVTPGRKECSPSEMPVERPKPDRISYYTEMVPKKSGILRAATHQRDKSFSKYDGKQELANAISPLIMLRLHKSKVWVPKLVNDILKNGDILYHDAMFDALKERRDLKITDFSRNVTYEDKDFEVDVKHFSVVGKLVSTDNEVLDLQTALETFLTDHDCCVINNSVLPLGVWVEDGTFYMFDPNERDGNGRYMVRKNVVSGNGDGSILSVEMEKGYACVTFFKDLKELVELYMYNITPVNWALPFDLAKVEVRDMMEKPDDWFSFQGLVRNKWILRAHISQATGEFSPESRNNQCVAMAFMAITYDKMKSLEEWTSDTMDEIIRQGDKLYLNSVEALNESGQFVEKQLLVNEIKTSFPLEGLEAKYEVDDCLVNGIIDAENENDALNLKRAIDVFFKDHECGILTVRNISMAIWKTEDAFYYFDSHTRDEQGVIANFGTACVLRTLDTDELTKAIETNLQPGTENLFNISRIKVELYENTEDGIVRPPLQNYTPINDDTAILTSVYSINSPKFEICAGKQALPTCLMAFAINKLIPSYIWTTNLMDNAVVMGNDFYKICMGNIYQNRTGEEGVNEEDPHEESVNTDNVTKQLSVGVNKFDFDFEEVGDGNIKETLKDAIKAFFEEGDGAQNEDNNKELIVETEPLTTAIWKDDNLFYLFDPRPRTLQGKVFGSEEWDEEYVPATDEQSKSSFGVVDDEDKSPDGDGNPDTGGSGEGGPMKEEEEYEEVDDDNFEGLSPVEKYMTHGGEGDETDEYEGEDDGMEQQEEEIAKKSSSYWREQEKTGTACTLRFTKLDDLVEHLYQNFTPQQRVETEYKLKALKMNNVPEVRHKFHKGEEERSDAYDGNWYNFEEIEHGRWILRGTLNLCNAMFPSNNQDRQDLTSCFAALAFSKLYKMRCLTNENIDRILMYGDKLFTVLLRLEQKNIENARQTKLQAGEKFDLTDDQIQEILKHRVFDVDELVKKICIAKYLVKVNVEAKNVVGDLNAQNFEDILDLVRGLTQFFEENKYGIVQAKGQSVAVWKGENVYYMFDPLKRGPSGLGCPNGTACITRYLQTEPLAHVIYNNTKDVMGLGSFEIHKITLEQDLCPRERAPVIDEDEDATPKTIVGGYVEISPGKRIIRASTNIGHPDYYNDNGYVLSLPIAIVTLTMSLIHKTTNWTKPILDNIMSYAIEFYEDNWIEPDYDDAPCNVLDQFNFRHDYQVGVVKANCEVRNTLQRGLIDIKGANVINLRQGIEKFFEENTHGILITDLLTAAIWEEKEKDTALIYVFDPTSKGPAGMPTSNGKACLLTFVNAKMTADHIISCILDLDQRMSEFVIVPVEPTVGNINKRKRKKLPCDNDMLNLPRCRKHLLMEQKRRLRRIVSEDRKRKEEKRRAEFGRKTYAIISPSEAILRGSKSQTSDSYLEQIRGFQDIPNCTVAIVLNQILSVDCWNQKFIDLILDTGSQVYVDSYIAYNPKDKKLGLESLVRKFFFDSLEIHITVYKSVVTDKFNLETVSHMLESYFQNQTYCMLSFEDQWVTIFFKSGYFYVFDPHDRDIQGNKVDKGTAVVLRFNDIDGLSKKLMTNLGCGCYSCEGDPAQDFSLWFITVD